MPNTTCYDMGLELKASAEEISRLQRCINDLVSLLALPAVWSGSEPSRIFEILLDALLPMVYLDVICGRVEDPVSNAPIEVNQSRSFLQPNTSRDQ